MQDYLQQYQRDLALRGYSERTQINYKGNLKEFLEYSVVTREIPGREKIKDYLYYLIHEKQSSPSKIKQAYSSIRYFYTQTLQQSWEGLEIPRFKKKKTLPLVFSREEVAALLQHSGNLKYKALFSLIYSSGLRGNEAVHLQIEDIKRSAQKLLVHQGKGGKDRYTVLSLNCLKILEDYWRAWRPHKWLFCGRHPGMPLHLRSCQHAFYKAKQSAGITRQGSLHTLRHSFASHFLEAGGSIFHLQKILGHKNVKTTLIYAHIQEEKLRVLSPFDVYGSEFQC